MTALERISANCTEDGDCLVWGGATDGGGRPRLSIHAGANQRTKTVQPRRLVWESAKGGPIRKGMVVTITCGCALCLNPAHMELITHSEVIRRTAKSPITKSRRHIAGLKVRVRSTLDQGKVDYIRSSDKKGCELALELGIAPTTVSAVRRGRRWKDYSNPFAGLGA